MATVTGDSRFANFPAAEFRTAIENTMIMGLPQTESERITFRWTVERTMANTDEYDLTATPTTEDAPDDVRVPAAVEYKPLASQGDSSALGDIQNSRIVVTLTDTYYPQITSESGRRADRMVLGGDVYEVENVVPLGIFGVEVYQVYGTAIDES